MRTELERLILFLAILLAGAAGPAEAQEAPKQSPPGDEDRFAHPLPAPPPAPFESPRLLGRASATTTVIMGDDLETLGVRFLTDALRIAPGLEVQRVSAAESNVSVRSYNDDASASQGILGLIDGRQVNNEFFGSVIWETLPVSLDEIKKIEVIRGPASFLYGPNAMHGLINIVTRSPLDYQDHGVYFHGYAGSYRSNVETFTYVRREGSTGLKTTISHDDIGEFDPRNKNTKDKVFLDARFVTELGAPDQRLDVSAGVNEQKFSTIIPAFGPGGVVPTARFFTTSQEPYARAVYTYDGLRVETTWTRFQGSPVAEPPGIYTDFTVVADTADIDLQYSIRLPESNTLSVGTGYRYSTFVITDPDLSNGRRGTGLVWGFLQDEWDIDQTLLITAGLRLDEHSVAGASLSPRLSLVWTLDHGDPGPTPNSPLVGQYLRVTAGTGFRNPSLRELWLTMPLLIAPGAQVIGNTDLKPEKMRSFELGYWGRPMPQLQVECSVYYNLVDRVVSFLPTSVPTTFQPQNDEKDRAYGLETEVEYQFSKGLFGFGNYAFEIRQDRDTHTRHPDAPRHKANGGARVVYGDLTTTVWATFFDDVTFIDPSSGMATGSVRQYALLNAQVSYHLKLGATTDGSVFLQAFNLLDHDHQEHPDGDSYGLILTGGFQVSW